MQFFSFENGDPILAFAGWRISVQVITFENVYGLAPEAIRVTEHDGSWSVHAAALSWAGGQERTPGEVNLSVERLPNGTGLSCQIRARHSQTIRCVKLILSGLPSGTLLARGWEESDVSEGGAIYEYPGGPRLGGANDRTIQTPLVFLRPDDSGSYVALRSLDDQVRAKRFAAYRRDGAVTLELIHEDAASRMASVVDVPAWRVERTEEPTAIVQAHMDHVASTYGLKRWEERSDVPDWAREIALVVALHGMHWSGYIFNTYAQMAEALRWVAERIEGRRVLAYLPGWEGRYYWQYGNFRPDPRLGGAEGFAELVNVANATGVHLMPMFAAHSANVGLPNFEQWGESSRLRTAAGFIEQGNKPDWDISRAHDPAWQAILNPGAPAWRRRLLDQVCRTVDTFGLETHSVFFDTSHWWQNDPNHPVYDGLVDLRNDLKRRYPELLVTGEGWYDALSAVTPVSHASAHIPVRWVDAVFTAHNRSFAHLSTGDPSRGSTGVHERGTRPFEIGPLARHHWPTVTIVDGTIDHAPEQVEHVINQARTYVNRFLPPR